MRRSKFSTPEEEIAQKKQQIIASLERGEASVIDVSRLYPRERNLLRQHANRWMRENGWRGATTYNRESETLTIQRIERREEST